jgi:hypothetical protein
LDGSYICEADTRGSEGPGKRREGEQRESDESGASHGKIGIFRIFR